jgi:hypothetical protein
MPDIEVQKIATLLESSSWREDVDLLTALLGAPTFVQEGEWAQFDPLGSRVCVGPAAEGAATSVGLMVKVPDVEAAASWLASQGCEVGEPTLGAHERQVVARAKSGQKIVAYSPL